MLSTRLRALNPWVEDIHDLARVEITPEADRAAAQDCGFEPAYCELCGGPLKPGIVMFGEGLHENAFGPALEAASRARLVLVAGTSLIVSTGMWVVQEALRAGTSLAVSTGLWVVHEAMRAGAALIVVNRGVTAVDRFADVRIEAGTSEVLPQIATALAG